MRLVLSVAVAALAAACPLAPSSRCQARLGVDGAQASERAIAIAVVDTGVSPVGGLVRAIGPGVDLVDRDTVATDGNGHGTAMASIAAARPVTHGRVVGVCASCTIVPVRVSSGGLAPTALVAAGVRWAVANNARVVNLSLGTSVDDPELDDAIADAVARGVVVVVAAGNGGSREPIVGGYPAAAVPGAITVAAADAKGNLYPWSNRGDWVDVAAPGSLPAIRLGGGVFTALGTSVAAAYVSGLVGRMLAVDPSLTPTEVESILTGTGTVRPGLAVRSGRTVDPQAAVAAARAS